MFSMLPVRQPARGRADRRARATPRRCLITVFLDQAHQVGAVELARVHALQGLGAAPLQCSIRSPNSCEAQPTPPSRKAKRSSGKRLVTPSRKIALAVACPAAAKCPIWL